MKRKLIVCLTVIYFVLSCFGPCCVMAQELEDAEAGVTQISRGEAAGLAKEKKYAETGLTQISRDEAAGLAKEKKYAEAGLTQISRGEAAGLAKEKKYAKAGLTQISEDEVVDLAQESRNIETGDSVQVCDQKTGDSMSIHEQTGDVPSVWAQTEVEAARSVGIISKSDNFDYHKNITRYEFSMLIWRMLCAERGISPEDTNNAGTVGDVNASNSESSVNDMNASNSEGSVNDMNASNSESSVNDMNASNSESSVNDMNASNSEGSASNSNLVNAASPFSDVSDRVLTDLYEAGIVKGMEDGMFYPDKTLTREQGASFVTRTAKYLGIRNPNGDVMTFYDGEFFSDWAVTDIKFVSAQKTPDGVRVMSGYESRFNPKNPYTVEQAILTVYRLYHSLELGDCQDTSWLSKTGWRLTDITLSAAGDCTLGRDIGAAYGTSLDAVYDSNDGDASVFFKNVTQFFNDDITIVNFEGTLTDSNVPANKTFRFKGRKAYTEILKTGSIDVVNIANNHSYDYLYKGYADTVETLSKAGIGISGNEYVYVKEINGIKLGFYGLAPMGSPLTQSYKDTIAARIKSLKNMGAQYIIGSFHWGIEKAYTANANQRAIAHYAVDAGTDLIIGHHPHVLQNTEVYNGVQIMYSLGNFCFGGNRNPSDKDTAVFQANMTFDIETGKMLEEKRTFYPYRLSSVSTRNDYQPVPVYGAAAQRVRAKLGI